MVPASAEQFVSQDLAGFGASVTAFRAQLEGGTLMLYKDLKGTKAVSTSSADTVGKVSGFLLDPATRSLVALAVQEDRQRQVHPVVGPHRPSATDAVTVADDSVITEGNEQIDALAGKDHGVIKKRVLATSGDELGKVKDIDFDPETGALNFLVVDKAEIAASRLRGVGSWAVVVDPA